MRYRVTIEQTLYYEVEIEVNDEDQIEEETAFAYDLKSMLDYSGADGWEIYDVEAIEDSEG